MKKKVIYKENGIEKELDFEELNEIDSIELIETDDEDDKSTITGKINGITPFVCTIVFLILGFYKGLWHPGWIVFLLIPLVPTFLCLFKKNRGSITGFLSLLICITYIVLGFLCDWWHPGWIIFLLIPIIGILVGSK